jgi:hypothetical protein
VNAKIFMCKVMSGQGIGLLHPRAPSAVVNDGALERPWALVVELRRQRIEACTRACAMVLEIRVHAAVRSPPYPLT